MSKLVCAFVLVACFMSKNMAIATSSNKNEADKAFCTNQGGQVKWYAMWNGNAPGTIPVGIKISKSMEVCSIPREDGANVYLVALDTLTSVQPTLAVLAFQSRTKPNKSNGTSNPSTSYCNQLGGTCAGTIDAQLHAPYSQGCTLTYLLTYLLTYRGYAVIVSPHHDSERWLVDPHKRQLVWRQRFLHLCRRQCDGHMDTGVPCRA